MIDLSKVVPSEEAQTLSNELWGQYANISARLIQHTSDTLRQVDEWLVDTAVFTPRSSAKARDLIAPLILPDPVDPLVEALREVTADGNPATMAAWQKEANTLRTALAKRGLQIVPVQPFPTATGHADNCEWHCDQYPWECSCGAIHNPEQHKPKWMKVQP